MYGRGLLRPALKMRKREVLSKNVREYDLKIGDGVSDHSKESHIFVLMVRLTVCANIYILLLYYGC